MFPVLAVYSEYSVNAAHTNYDLHNRNLHKSTYGFVSKF